jgi:exopolyphosphatase/guanosine-5'-triphosphate,3'-diphosphate pyrophosphatase
MIDTTQPIETLAAIDLGSNSFHMIIARWDGERFQVVDRLKEMVRLGGGLTRDGGLTPEAEKRALSCLERFGERLRGMPEGSVRAVGTNTLRQAKRATGFIERAEAALGHPIEIISGQEEGRVIYAGIANGITDHHEGNRLVVDIGGGSTEVIIGKDHDVLACESHYMGCVSFSQRYFPDGELTRARFDKAVIGGRQELRAIEHRYRKLGWSVALGSSGTIKAAQEIVIQSGLGPLGLTLASLHALRDALVDAGHADAVSLAGLSDDRRPVFHGGLAVLIAVFESLQIQEMIVSESALREGLIFELAGRVQRDDIRDDTIAEMCARHLVDTAHAERVERCAVDLFAQLDEPWGLGGAWAEDRLRWACRIHEVGLSIAHSRHHKHGSYIVENAHMPGFSRQDQQLLWALVRSHRRRFKPHRFDNQPDHRRKAAIRLAIVLRLAVVLCRGRVDDAAPAELTATARSGKKLALGFAPGYLDANPLTVADLETERDYLEKAGFKLRW